MHMQQTLSKKLKNTFRPRLVAGVISLALLFTPLLGLVPAFQSAGIQTTVLAACESQDEKKNDPKCIELPPIKPDDACPQGECIIKKYIQPALNLMAGLVGLGVTISIIAAGIRYTTSADSPQKVSEAKQRMVTSIFVLIGFFTFYALMNYLIPGGL
jgi:hypothetical protein